MFNKFVEFPFLSCSIFLSKSILYCLLESFCATVLIEIAVRKVQRTKMIINNGILRYCYDKLQSTLTMIMIMENHHQSDDELSHNTKSVL